MYYPAETTLHMGPTSVVRGTPYFTVDRGADWPQSEDRLDPALQPPPPAGEELQSRLRQWKGISGHPEGRLLSDEEVSGRAMHADIARALFLAVCPAQLTKTPRRL